MPLYLLSLRLSLHTAWRYLIAMVFFGVFVLVLIRKAPVGQWVWLFTLVPVVAIAIAFFMISLLLASVLGIVMLAGICCALMAAGYKIRLEIGHLLRAAVLFGMVAILCYIATGLVGAAILYVAGLAGGPGNAAALADQLRQGSQVAHAILLLVLIPPALFLAATVVPLTAIVHAGEVRRPAQQISFGFGKGLPHLAPLALAILYGTALTVILGHTGLIVIVMQPSNALFVPLIWAASWFFSLGMLIWEQTAMQAERDLALAADRIRANRIDPRGLRHQRERDNPDIA